MLFDGTDTTLIENETPIALIDTILFTENKSTLHLVCYMGDTHFVEANVDRQEVTESASSLEYFVEKQVTDSLHELAAAQMRIDKTEYEID